MAHVSAPATLDLEDLLRDLVRRVELTDPTLLAEIASGREGEVAFYVDDWPRLTSCSTPLRHIAVLAGSRRQRRRLEETALRAGWLVQGGSADQDDPVALTRLLMSANTTTVLLGADHSPGGDEKRHLPELAALLAAATRLRPELTVILAGGAAAFESQFAITGDADLEIASAAAAPVLPPADGASAVDAAGKDDQSKRPGHAPEPIAVFDETADPEAAADGAVDEAVATAPEADAADAADRAVDEAVATPPEADAADAADPADAADAAPAAPAAPADSAPPATSVPELTLPAPAARHASAAPALHVILAPDPEAGRPIGSALQQVLEGVRVLPNDSRLGIARSIASLAYVLDRSIELVEVGLQGGLRAHSEPIGQGHFTVVSSYAMPAAASFAPSDPSDEVIDGVAAWSTIALDRHQLMDRLNDTRLVPWGEADGSGAIFRLAAAKAAVTRLVDATPDISEHPLPELLVAAGGIFASLPPAVVALALADLIRRPGATSMVCDQARLLGPIGVIEDEAERRRLLANLAEEILMPLGSLILPAGVRPGRNAGTLHLKGVNSIAEIELHPGAIQVVDLPPGRSAKVAVDFRDAVKLGTRAHHFDLDVVGGLGGLLVDLRDIPLRISDRPESRRAALEAWQRGMWPEVDE